MVSEGRTAGYRAAGRFQSDKTAAGRWHARRAAGVGGMRHSDNACGNGSRCAAGGAARRSREIERVAGDRPDLGFARERQAELRRSGDAER